MKFQFQIGGMIHFDLVGGLLKAIEQVFCAEDEPELKTCSGDQFAPDSIEDLIASISIRGCIEFEGEMSNQDRMDPLESFLEEHKIPYKFKRIGGKVMTFIPQQAGSTVPEKILCRIDENGEPILAMVAVLDMISAVKVSGSMFDVLASRIKALNPAIGPVSFTASQNLPF